MPNIDAGKAIIKELWDEAYVAKRATARTSFNAPVHDFAEGVNFGEIWSRPGLERKQRCLITIAMLVAMNRSAQATGYINAALNSGCTVDELRETLFQAAIYVGLPASIEAFKVAEEVLRSRDLIE